MAEIRKYRRLHGGKDLVYFNVKIEQTDLEIGAVRMLRKEAVELVKGFRKDLEDYIRIHPQFLTTLSPLACFSEAPAIVKRMCRAAEKAGVGPMAAVAGAVSEMVGKSLQQFSREVIVENGGDIYIKSSHPRVIGIYSGDSPLNQKIGIQLEPNQMPLGVCTSSGKIGHSLSMGNADAVMVTSEDTALADAAATAVGNRVKSPSDIDKALNFAAKIDGVRGVLIICGRQLGVWGDLKLIKL